MPFEFQINLIGRDAVIEPCSILDRGNVFLAHVHALGPEFLKAQLDLPRAFNERKAFLVGIQADENTDLRDPRERFIKPEKTAGAKITD